MGCKQTHRDRIGLAVQRLNHSATLSQCSAVRGLCDLFCDVFFLIAFADKNCFWIFRLPPQYEKLPTVMGFEPTHGDRIALQVQRPNHSAILSQSSAVRGLRDLSCNVSFLIAFANNNCFWNFRLPPPYEKIPTGMGFEPTHGDRIALAVQRLNHSATLSQSSAVRGLCDLFCNVFFLIAFTNNCFWNFGLPPQYEKIPTVMGSEPTHGDCIGLQVQRPNHSATLS